MSTMLFPTNETPMLLSEHDGRFQASPVTGNIHTLVDLPGASQGAQRAA
jgi:hypothetical protein